MKTVILTDEELHLLQGMILVFNENTEKLAMKNYTYNDVRKCLQMQNIANNILLKLTDEV